MRFSLTPLHAESEIELDTLEAWNITARPYSI
jgi:hypothetical protein